MHKFNYIMIQLICSRTKNSSYRLSTRLSRDLFNSNHLHFVFHAAFYGPSPAEGYRPRHSFVCHEAEKKSHSHSSQRNHRHYRENIFFLYLNIKSKKTHRMAKRESGLQQAMGNRKLYQICQMSFI